MMDTGALTREAITAVYQQVLGRDPLDSEVAAQLAARISLDRLLRMALDSEEYAERLQAAGRPRPSAPTVVNVFHPDLAEWGHAPGTSSPDGIAIVGRDGWLFLAGGSNSNLGQHVGEIQMQPEWLDEWRTVSRQRQAEAHALGVRMAVLVVPDKLAVYEEHYPEPLVPAGPRPIERLLQAGDIPLVYPLSELRAAAADHAVYLRADTHLTYRGNGVLFASVCAALGITTAPDVSELPMRSYVTSGDLGVKFDPTIVDVVSTPGTFHRARITADNRDAIAAVGGHLGTRRVFVNDQAPDDRVAVIFGDSFGFASEYYQGMSWFLAQTFRETHFVWVPFGWDPAYTAEVGAQVVLIQGAERFAGRVPHPSIEVRRLAEETLRRKQGLGIQSAFGD